MRKNYKKPLAIIAILVSVGLFSLLLLPRIIQKKEKSAKTIENVEYVKDDVIRTARQICEKKGWRWEDVRVDEHHGSINVWHPSPFGKSDNFYIDGKTGKLSSEYTITGVDKEGATSSVKRFYSEDGSFTEISYKDGVPDRPKKIQE